MPAVNIEQEMLQQIEEVKRDIEERPVFEPHSTQPGTPIVDPGLENMMRSAELLVKAMQEAAAEVAKRHREVVQSIVQQALEKEQEVKTFTERLLMHTGNEADNFNDMFRRFRDSALVLKQAMEILSLPISSPEERKN